MVNILNLNIVKIKPRPVPGSRGEFEYFAYVVEKQTLTSLVHLCVRRNSSPDTDVSTHTYLLADSPDWVRVYMAQNDIKKKGSK